MTLLERTRQIVPTPDLDLSRPWRRLLVAVGFGAVGALALVLALMIPAMAAWVADTQSPDSWVDALTLAPVMWALAHRGSTSVPGSEVAVTFPALGLTALAVLCAYHAAKAVLAQPEPNGDEDTVWWHQPAAYLGGYAGTGLVVTLLAWIGPARPNPVYVLPGAALVAAIGFALAMWRAEGDGRDAELAQVRDLIHDRLPVVLQRAMRPALRGAMALLGVGLVLVLLAVALSWSRVTEISGELETGLAGGVVLALGQLLALPNLAAWAGGWLSGAAVQIGPVTVGHAAVSPGVLPMVPILGGLPEAGAGPAWASFTPLIPVAVGALVGWWSAAELTSLASLKMKVQLAAVAGGLAAAVVLLLGFLGTMGVSGGEMSYVGPSPVTVLLLPLEVALGAAGCAAVLHFVRTRR